MFRCEKWIVKREKGRTFVANICKWTTHSKRPGLPIQNLPDSAAFLETRSKERCEAQRIHIPAATHGIGMPWRERERFRQADRVVQCPCGTGGNK